MLVNMKTIMLFALVMLVCLSQPTLASNLDADAEQDITDEADIEEFESLDDSFAAGSTLSIPSAAGIDESLSVMQIARRMYGDSATKGSTSMTFSYKGKCVSSVVLDVVDRQKFVSWLLYVPEMNAVVLAFRGTANPTNGITDAKFIPVSCSLDGLNCGKAHKGFYDLWMSHRSSIKVALKQFMSNHNVPTLYITGHSLGGAVGQLAAMDLINTMRKSPTSIARVNLITFGTPRVGNSKFADLLLSFRSKLLSIQRYAQTHRVLGHTIADPVTSLPPKSLGFQHAGTDKLTKQLSCSTCKSTPKIVLDLHAAARYVESLRAALRRPKLLACGTKSAFA